MLVSKNAKICVTPDAIPKICVTPNLKPQRESVVALGPQRKVFALAMYISFIFVSISFAFGPVSQWNMDLRDCE